MTSIGPYELDTVHCADALDFLRALPDGCADAVVTDPPYGTTACAWDTVVPFEPMWEQLRRIAKPRAAIVMTASQPFTSRLVMSNVEMFRYEWVWHKSRNGNFLNANRRPLKYHENVLVFGVDEPQYSPQFSAGAPYRNIRRRAGVQVNNGGKKGIIGHAIISDGRRYPQSVIHIPSEGANHPTQKPVALFAYLIRTYTQPGALVIDPFAGSGTCGIAARDTGRHFLLCDVTPEYVQIARDRLAAPYTPPLFVDDAPAPRSEQMSLMGDD